MAASIIVIEIPRQLPLAFILTRGSQGARAVWASRQGGNLRISRPKPAPTLTEIDPRLSHPSETPERVEQVVRLHLHRRPSGPVGEGEDPCPDTQDIAVGACVSADQAWSDPARMGQLLQTRRGEIHLQQIGHLHLVEACPMLRARHGWNFGQLSRHLTHPGGGGCSQRTGSSTSDRGRSRFSRQLPR
jgi:hypothetical protein